MSHVVLYSRFLHKASVMFPRRSHSSRTVLGKRMKHLISPNIMQKNIFGLKQARLSGKEEAQRSDLKERSFSRERPWKQDVRLIMSC